MRDAKRPTNPCACCCIFTFPKANNCTAPNQVLVVKQLSRPHNTHVLRYNFTHRQSRLYIYLKDDRYVSISRPIVGVVEKWVQHSSLLFLLFRCRYRKLARLPPPFSTVLLLLLLWRHAVSIVFFLTVDAAHQGVRWRVARVDCWRLPRPRSWAECRPTGVNFRSSSPWNLLAANNCAERRSWTSAGWPRPPTVSAGNHKIIKRLW